MKKFFIASVSVLFIAIAVFLVVATLYFKPFVKEQIQTQLANFGYENATVGDVSVGLYESSISDIDLKKAGNNQIGSIAVTYWPQQLLQKKINGVKIADGTLEVQLKSNGDVIAAGYRVPGALKSKPVEVEKASAGSTPAKKESTANTLPFNKVIVKNMQFTITTPAGKTIKGVADATHDLNSKSAQGALDLETTDVTALQEVAAIVKPDLANMVRNLSGTVGGNVQFDIPSIEKLDNIPGSGKISLKKINLKKDDIRIENLSTDLELTHLLPVSIPAGQSVVIDEVKKSVVKINNFKTKFGLEKSHVLDMADTSLNVAGGSITASPFKADLNNINTTVNLGIQHVDLAAISELLEIPAFDLNGKFNGTIPLKIKNGQIVVDQAVVNTVLQNAVGSKIKEKAQDFLSDKLGLPKAQPTTDTPAGETEQSGETAPAQQKPNVEDVLNGIIGNFGR